MKPDSGNAASRGLEALRALVLATLFEQRALVAGASGQLSGQLLMSGVPVTEPTAPGSGDVGGPSGDDSAYAASSEESEAERDRLIALVELARGGDSEAFGMLFDHYQGPVYRFLVHRTRSATLAEDLTSETFFRALRSMSSFRWQGKDFGAWLMTRQPSPAGGPVQQLLLASTP